MTANIDVVGEKREKVLTVPVEAIFKKDETEVVYVKKAEAAQGGRLAAASWPRSSPRARRTRPPPSSTTKDNWKEKFELREIETGLASVDKVQVVKGLEAGAEIAVEDPTPPEGEEGP